MASESISLILGIAFLANVFSLKPLDIEVMKRLGSRVNLIPVIAKADTLTPNDLETFKRRVSKCEYMHMYLTSVLQALTFIV